MKTPSFRPSPGKKLCNYPRLLQPNFAHVPAPRTLPLAPAFSQVFAMMPITPRATWFPSSHYPSPPRAAREGMGREALPSLPPVPPLAAAFPRSASRNRKVPVQLSPIRSCLPPPLPSLCPFLPPALAQGAAPRPAGPGLSRWGQALGHGNRALGTLRPGSAPSPEPALSQRAGLSGARGAELRS